MGDINWRRTFVISSLIFAIMLVCGSIYLHVKQKPHLGRLRHGDSHIATYAGDDAATSDVALHLPKENYESKNALNNNYNNYFYDRQEESYESDEATSTENNRNQRHLLSMQRSDEMSTLGVSSLKGQQMSETCLQCICETATQCQTTNCNENESCGIFRISRPYWIDAGRPKLIGDKSSTKLMDPNADYSHCVNNVYCAARTVIGFIDIYSRDCNNDEKVDCRDYVMLHILGPSECRKSNLSSIFENRMEQCLKKFSYDDK